MHEFLVRVEDKKGFGAFSHATDHCSGSVDYLVWRKGAGDVNGFGCVL
jgi:hypothetical protein